MNKKIAGLIIISAALVSLGIWEFWGRENLSYQDILVLKADAAANTIIETDDLATKKMESPSSAALMPEDAEWLVGMETVQFVARGTELHREYFIQSQYAVGNDTGKAVLCVPEDWLLSFPKTVRRGDKVSFYNGKVKVLEAIVAHALDVSGQEVFSEDNLRFSSAGMVNQIEIISTSEQLVELSGLAGEGRRFTVTYN